MQGDSVRVKCREMLATIANALVEIDEWPRAERVSWEQHLEAARRELEEIVYGDETGGR